MSETICIYCVDRITIGTDGAWVHETTKQSWCRLIEAEPFIDPAEIAMAAHPSGATDSWIARARMNHEQQRTGR
jgi:hypothetical protein